VRSRQRADLIEAFGVSNEVLETPQADYRFRVHLTKDAWARYLDEAARAIDYDNFKDEVARHDRERAHVYGQVWSALYRIQSQSQ
jgi:hypothetical protein